MPKTLFVPSKETSVDNILTDDGICLLHTIGSVDPPGPVNPFIQKRIFPGGIVPSLSDLVKPIEKTGLIVSDCETLIHHYDKTLKAWLERFLENKENIFEYLTTISLSPMTHNKYINIVYPLPPYEYA